MENFSLKDQVQKLSNPEIFARDGKGKFLTGKFVGRPFYVDYDQS